MKVAPRAGDVSANSVTYIERRRNRMSSVIADERRKPRMYLSWRIWLTYLLLLLVAVPWYWRLIPVSPEVLVLGVPPWVAMSIVASLGVSIFTATLLSRRWPDEEAEESVEARK